LKLYIFGTKKNAEMALFYFDRDYPHFEIAGFVEDAPSVSKVYGYPVLETEDFIQSCPPDECRLFAPLTSSSSRKFIFEKFKHLGYSFASYVSPDAILWKPEVVGENCFIQELNNIQFGTVVGDNCLFWAGNHIGHHSAIGSHTTFTSHVVMSGGCEIGEQCYFGVNVTIGDGLSICNDTFVGMGSLVTKNILEPGLYVGAPAKRIRSADSVL
jgi:sugar O-acyltransferase (sialic acid O-acetyltransferase NeuD family)